MFQLERTRKLKRILMTVGVILTIAAVITLFRGMQPVSSRDDSQTELILFILLGSVLLVLIAFLSALILHVLEKDITEELRSLKQKE